MPASNSAEYCVHAVGAHAERENQSLTMLDQRISAIDSVDFADDLRTCHAQGDTPRESLMSTPSHGPMLRPGVTALPAAADPAASFEDVAEARNQWGLTSTLRADRGSIALAVHGTDLIDGAAITTSQDLQADSGAIFAIGEALSDTPAHLTDESDAESASQTTLLQGTGAKFDMDEPECGVPSTLSASTNKSIAIPFHADLRANAPPTVIPDDERIFRGRWDTASCFDILPVSRVEAMCLLDFMEDVEEKDSTIKGLGSMDVPVLGRLKLTVEIRGYARAVRPHWYVVSDMYTGGEFDCILGLPTIHKCFDDEMKALLGIRPERSESAQHPQYRAKRSASRSDSCL
jgi:hypothetical protein